MTRYVYCFFDYLVYKFTKYNTIQIDNYSEEMLALERKKLKDTDSFTILDYVKTSIEILMNMKMEENENSDTSNINKQKNKNRQSNLSK